MVPSEVWAPSVRGEEVSSSAGWCQCRLLRGAVAGLLDNVGNIPRPAPNGWHEIGRRHPREIRNILERDCNAISSDLIKFHERRQQDCPKSCRTVIALRLSWGPVHRKTLVSAAEAGLPATIMQVSLSQQKAGGRPHFPGAVTCQRPQNSVGRNPEKGFCLLDAMTRLQAKDKG